MKQIIFYKRHADIAGQEGLRILPTHTPVDRGLILDAFEQSKNLDEKLLVPIGLTSWRTTLYADEVDMRFIGGVFREEELAQAYNRATPTILREAAKCES